MKCNGWRGAGKGWRKIITNESKKKQKKKEKEKQEQKRRGEEKE